MMKRRNGKENGILKVKDCSLYAERVQEHYAMTNGSESGMPACAL